MKKLLDKNGKTIYEIVTDNSYSLSELLIYANSANVNFENIYLDDKNFWDTTISNGNFKNSSIRFSSAHKSKFECSNFDYSNLEYSNFTGSNFNNSSFKKVIAVKSIFDNTNLSDCDFNNADLRNASFKNCNIEGAIFKNAQLDGACFKGTTLVLEYDDHKKYSDDENEVLHLKTKFKSRKKIKTKCICKNCSNFIDDLKNNIFLKN